MDIRTENRRKRILDVLKTRQPGLTAIFENINDPHNLSACLRTCDAVGISTVHLIYHGKQPFPKLGEKSSASARKWVDRIRYDSVDECFSNLRRDGFKIYTTHMSSDAVSVYDLDLTCKVALMFGNEHAGVSDESVAKADGNFLVPQTGMIQSLNISVATAVSLYEAYRQRKAAGLYDNPQIPESDFNQLYKDWLNR